MVDKEFFDSNVELWIQVQKSQVMALTLFLALQQADESHKVLALYREELGQ